MYFVCNVNTLRNFFANRPIEEAQSRAQMNQTITDFIREDLKGRIQTDHALPTKLTLPHLAEHYRVSLTPVRLAVNALLAEQVLLKQPNGRLQVNPAKAASDTACAPASEAPRPASRRDWEAVFVREILRESLRGQGAYLREEAMAQRFGIGRTVLRQAFHRLAGKGLLTHIPRRGWQVRTFDEADMRAYLIAREALELTALELARPHLIAADLERMLAGNAPDSAGANPHLDNNLHRYFIEKSGNAYIQDFFDRHGLYYTVLFDFAAPEAHVMNEMASQHREILTALLANDWTRAREALAEHIRAQHPVVKRLMERIAEGE